MQVPWCLLWPRLYTSQSWPWKLKGETLLILMLLCLPIILFFFKHFNLCLSRFNMSKFQLICYGDNYACLFFEPASRTAKSLRTSCVNGLVKHTPVLMNLWLELWVCSIEFDGVSYDYVNLCEHIQQNLWLCELILNILMSWCVWFLGYRYLWTLLVIWIIVCIR
jgi:hypothetical protein